MSVRVNGSDGRVYLRSADGTHQAGSVSASVLAGPSSAVVAPAGSPTATISWQYNLDVTAPFPQDTPLTKIPATLALVADGECTDADIAFALGRLSEQQGNYAGICARYLGLLVRDSSTSPSTLRLTDAGEIFITLTPTEQFCVLRDLVNRIDEDLMVTKGYADSTASYREATLAAWRTSLDSPALFGVEASAVTATASELRFADDRPARVEPAPRYVVETFQSCDRCWQVLLPSGVCGSCE